MEGKVGLTSRYPSGRYQKKAARLIQEFTASANEVG